MEKSFGVLKYSMILWKVVMDLTSRGSNRVKEPEVIHTGGCLKLLHFCCLNVPDTNTKSHVALRR
jgi:hypothetical protein